MPPAAPALTQVVAAPAAQRPVREANRWRGSGGTGRFPRLLAGRRCTEPNPTLAGIALHIHDPLERDRVAAVLGLERDRRFTRPGPHLGGAERLLERVRALRGDERAHDLPAVERDLDPDPLTITHSKPPPRGCRGRNQDGRTQPASRRGRAEAP